MRCHTRGTALALVLALACATSAVTALSSDVMFIGVVPAHVINTRVPTVGTPRAFPRTVPRTVVTELLSLADVRGKLAYRRVHRTGEDVAPEQKVVVASADVFGVFTEANDFFDDEESGAAVPSTKEASYDSFTEVGDSYDTTHVEQVEETTLETATDTPPSPAYVSIAAAAGATSAVCFSTTLILFGLVSYLVTHLCKVFGSAYRLGSGTAGAVFTFWTRVWTRATARVGNTGGTETKATARGDEKGAGGAETTDLSRTNTACRERGRVVDVRQLTSTDCSRMTHSHRNVSLPRGFEPDEQGSEMKTPPRRSSRLTKKTPTSKSSPNSHFNDDFGPSSSSASEEEDDCSPTASER
jgi:hypothetical protein